MLTGARNRLKTHVGYKSHGLNAYATGPREYCAPQSLRPLLSKVNDAVGKTLMNNDRVSAAVNYLSAVQFVSIWIML